MNAASVKYSRKPTTATPAGLLPVVAGLVLGLACLVFVIADATAAVRLKDLASIQGVRHNQLVGYGIVVGLDGSGDGRNAAFTIQGLANAMRNMGLNINPDDIQVRNAAAVMVTAKLPPFAKSGQNIDVTVSSVGDASSLQGGTLLVTPLKGLDNQIYAIAQGPLSIGGFEPQGPTAPGRQQNHQTVARIPSGASVEREVPVSFAQREEIVISLNSPDFTTVQRMTQAINNHLGNSAAHPRDGATVVVRVPENYRDNEIFLLAELENLQIVPDNRARVVLDERTGTVVMGENVRIRELAVAHGDLNLQVAPALGPEELLQPDAAPMAAEGDQLVRLDPGATLGEVVQALNAVGVAPRDLIAIFQSIKASGALNAELEII
ncbi:flagellar basal body P-ring protein FlgI [Desulfurivibrio alkaliphilus]|uniref:Flagellar P-ring protein n=1 Tax=Desulfurivibrio alkaliphilus (strain DSM 19089 / UNIQEM U267 / AHT2) TaxID=589865 RepID=D6Z726_DESAT|nr:flagellar basal body P-ring protein FlgI [Desulfurivibrio alkaliphilus]ADH87013.1 flagellar P-ring protein [Desulfurivibrio alkaliphilus AHT 2]